MKLTKLERRLLINQYKILKKLEGTDDYDELIRVLEEGYTMFYSDVTRSLYDELPEHDCKFVLDVLDVYRVLNRYYEDSGDEDFKKEVFAEFAGFDGNNESHMMAFTKFLIEDQGKFTEQKGRGEKTDGFNSHMPCCEIYQRMLTVWEDSRRKHPLSADLAKSIVEAAKRPE